MAGRAMRRARAFSRNEDGSLLIFGVYIFVLILMVGGIGIDLMRFERDRADLQYTLDRAVLAAADLDQTLDPATVVANYLDKAGLSAALSSVTVDEGLGFRKVTASASSETNTQFMHMTGLDTLSIPANSAAEERIDSVEISLVLDVSGSMNSNSRLTNLKVAAKDFVDNMVDNTEAGKMSISIVPYATQVSLPQSLAEELNLSDEHNYSRCVDFAGADFSELGIDHTQELKRTTHFSPWSNMDGRDDDPKKLVSTPVCEPSSAREVLAVQNNRNQLKNFIQNLSAGGNTSIDLGMKWGMALLDPSMNAPLNAMIGKGHVPNEFSARPSTYEDQDTLKVIVLMTDGRNTSQYFVEDDYREGDSNIWWNDAEERYSVYNPVTERWFWPHNYAWADHPYGQDGYGCVKEDGEGWDCKNRTEPGSAVRLSYPDLWAYTSLARNAKKNYYPWMNDSEAWNVWYNGVFDYVGTSTKNSRALAICDAAKDRGVIVFTIGFEAPSFGQAVLKDCASSASHYFDVDGLEISDAFASIASSIRKLRLTQ